MCRKIALLTLALGIAAAALPARTPTPRPASNCFRDACGGICCVLPSGKVICTQRICQ